MANLYYREDLPLDAFRPGSRVEVLGEEARHAVRVSRLREGERILVGNGAGIIGAGPVTSVAKDRFVVELDGVEESRPPGVELVLVQALAKGDRDERAVEQATEFGVDRIIPWEASRSVSRWSGRGGGQEKVERGVAKWARIAREAAKQSIRYQIPSVSAPVGIAELEAIASGGDALVIALHPRRGKRLTERLARGLDAAIGAVYLVVGPEGGFADEELDALESAGAEVLVLGDTVLRTSSAGPAALAVLNSALGRW
ncbi:16S rRNA (uracil(1498)-N(3))-methyltransferase [Leucobacter sp. CSA2]|uniref:Ribosomal RNA small subunit methyltransferase E n=1 Tax=Leucobacter edaphi TaxID=2796472 RepID=A0A934QBM5_9MICO|nr:16S rRNA (uracil(1498)-N(3))-methyltransferase [Leucobacter edaphi]